MEPVKSVRIATNADLLAGLMFIVIGGGAVAITLVEQRVGTARSMGPGFVPLGLGLLLIVFGVMVAVRGMLAPQETVELPLAIVAMSLVTAAMVAFGLLIERAGLVAAVPAVVALSRLAGGERRWGELIVLCAALALLCWFVFVWALSVPIPVWG